MTLQKLVLCLTLGAQLSGTFAQDAVCSVSGNVSLFVEGLPADALTYCSQSCGCNSTVVEVEEIDPEENLGLAFGLVTAAGLSTTIGAALVFWDRFFSLASTSVLGAALGFSGGVMLYVSFVEIFQKSVSDFETCDCLWDGADEEDSAAYVVATLCFFAGVLITYSLDYLVHKISHYAGHKRSRYPPEISSRSATSRVDTSLDDFAIEQPKTLVDDEDVPDVEVEKKKKLKHMGSMTALAIGLHNFPEGLATFVATLADPAVGIALTVAIAIHNIPEGLCVSVPVYYATGSRWKGFCMAFWSGVTEIIGAALGYAFLKEVLGPAAFASLFGVVAGMMVTIVLKELLPTAHRYDPKDRFVTNSVFIGALVMAISLVLFVV